MSNNVKNVGLSVCEDSRRFEGFSISSEDLSSAKTSAELTESELESLSGGYGDQTIVQNTVAQETVTTVPEGYLDQ